MIRRAVIALTTTALAFSGLAAAGDDDAFATIEGLKVVAKAGTITVTGSPVFGGGAPVVIADDGGDFAPGLDIVSATIFQDGDNIVATMEVTGNVAPLALYSIPLGITGAGDNRFFAYANTTQDPDFQVANLDDGYSSSSAQGTMSGTTITWSAPLSIFGAQPGAKIGPGAFDIEAAFGASPGGAASLNGTAFSPITGGFDTAEWIGEPFTIGGGMRVEIVGGDVEELINAKVRKGVATVTLGELPAGNYTVTVTTGFADASFEKVFKVKL